MVSRDCLPRSTCVRAAIVSQPQREYVLATRAAIWSVRRGNATSATLRGFEALCSVACSLRC